MSLIKRKNFDLGHWLSAQQVYFSMEKSRLNLG